VVEELTQEERLILSLVAERGSVPIDDLTTCLNEVRSLTGKRRLILVVAQRDWGIEFLVELAQIRASAITPRQSIISTASLRPNSEWWKNAE
jgi:hypothetical protein